MKNEQLFIVRYNEIFLKSKAVAKSMLFLLKNNIKEQFKQKNISSSINILDRRIFVNNFEESKKDEIEFVLENTFGVESFSFAYVLPSTDIASIKSFCKQQFANYIKKTDTFAIRAKCIGTSYRTYDLEKTVGDLFDAKVNLKNSKKTIYIEVRQNKTYIYTKTTKGMSGLPVGASGKNLVLISGGIDSPVASFLMQKRGCQNIYLHFHSLPYTSNTSIEKIKEILIKFKKYQPFIKLLLFPFAEIQNHIKVSSHPKIRIVLYRRSMMRMASMISSSLDIKMVTTGESLAQVSSQTVDNLSIINKALSVLPLRPLVGLNKNEIIDIARNIGTLDLSNIACEDTCTLFTPKHPTANAKPEDILQAEKEMKIEALEKKLLKKIEEIIL